MMHKHKKSQVEVIGIAVVIILLLLGFSFYISFMNKGSATYKKDIDNDILLISNILTTMIRTNTGINLCPGSENIRTLLEDCINNPNTRGSIVCNGKHSCDFLDDIIVNEFIDPILTPLGKYYNFTITGTEHINSYSNSGTDPNIGCNKIYKEVIPSAPIRIYGFLETAEIQIKLCY